jgi:phosphatidylserine decarboxylase
LNGGGILHDVSQDSRICQTDLQHETGRLILREPRYARVAGEGVPILLLAMITTALGFYFAGWIVALLPASISVALYCLFRDPNRAIPAHPLAAVSPVDGVVVEVTMTDNNVTGAAARKIILLVDSFGAYTARSPVEGTILDPRVKSLHPDAAWQHPGLWIRTDEGDDVLLRFHGYRFGLVPHAFSRYGDRVGQGARCAYLRLTRFAEVCLPINSRVLVVAGQRVSAGTDILGTLPHP